jgi:hypothetical protein
MKVVHAVWFHLYGDDPCIYGIYSTLDKARAAFARVVAEYDGRVTGHDKANTWRGDLSIAEYAVDDED